MPALPPAKWLGVNDEMPSPLLRFSHRGATLEALPGTMDSVPEVVVKRGKSPAVVRHPYVQLFAAAPVAVVVVEGETMTVVYANPAVRGISGALEDECEGGLLGDILPDPIAERAALLVRQCAQSGERFTRVEVEHHPSAGDDRHVSLSAWPLEAPAGSRACVALLLEDVSDDVRERRLRVAMSEQLREINEHLLIAALREQELTQLAESANEAKSAFLAMMSHELRTPLTAIIGYEELISDGLTGPVTEEQKNALSRVRASAMHLLALIEQVLTLTNIELKRESVQRERFTLGQLIRSVAVLISPLASEKRLEFTVSLDDEDAVIESDPMRLKQVLVNLLGNAVRFTDAGRVTLDVRLDAQHATFAVRDTGIGIALSDQERVFEPFWQAEQRPTRKVGGSGLGLTVARRTARLLGGDVTVESALGRGSTFTLRVPLAA